MLEDIYDGELWIWGCNVGSAGGMNDIHVLNTSSIASDMFYGRHITNFEYTINVLTRNLCYYLVDGIFPKWAIFRSTIQEAIFKKEKTVLSNTRRI